MIRSMKRAKDVKEFIKNSGCVRLKSLRKVAKGFEIEDEELFRIGPFVCHKQSAKLYKFVYRGVDASGLLLSIVCKLLRGYKSKIGTVKTVRVVREMEVKLRNEYSAHNFEVMIAHIFLRTVLGDAVLYEDEKKRRFVVDVAKALEKIREFGAEC